MSSFVHVANNMGATIRANMYTVYVTNATGDNFTWSFTNFLFSEMISW